MAICVVKIPKAFNIHQHKEKGIAVFHEIQHGRARVNALIRPVGDTRQRIRHRLVSNLVQILPQSVNFGRRTLVLFFESTTAVQHLVGFLLERSNDVLKLIGAAGATILSE